MNVRSILASVAAVVAFSAGISASAAEPALSGSDPKALIVTERTDGNVTLHGSNLTRPDTSGFTFEKDVQVYGRTSRGDGAWRKLPISGWSSSQISVRLPNDPFMKSRDQVEFKVVVRGMGESLPLPLMVQGYPTQPPTIESITPMVRQLTGEKTSATINLTGKNFAPDATVVDETGKALPLGRLIPASGEAVVWIDAGRPGVHSVQVVTAAGKSAPAKYTVVGAPQITAFDPAKITLSDPIPAEIPLRLSFQTGQPPEVSVKTNDSAAWQAMKLSDASAESGVLRLPTSQLVPGQSVQIKLATSVGGETTAAVPVERIMKVRTDVRLPKLDRVAPTVRQGADRPIR